LEASDLGRKVSARDHAVIATRHADRKSMETNSICEIKNWDADEIYDLSSKDKIDLSNSRVVGIIKSTFNEHKKTAWFAKFIYIFAGFNKHLAESCKKEIVE
jgi:hypothetical protein